MTDRYFLYRRTVARERVTDSIVEIAVYNPVRCAWILAPELVTYISGIGGEPGLIQITRTVASEIIARCSAEATP